MMTLDLPPDAETRLAELAAETGKSTAVFARDILLARLDLVSRAALGEERLGAPDDDERPSFDGVVRQVQALAAPYRPSTRSAVDELIADRRAEAACEEG